MQWRRSDDILVSVLLWHRFREFLPCIYERKSCIPVLQICSQGWIIQTGHWIQVFLVNIVALYYFRFIWGSCFFSPILSSSFLLVKWQSTYFGALVVVFPTVLHRVFDMPIRPIHCIVLNLMWPSLKCHCIIMSWICMMFLFCLSITQPTIVNPEEVSFTLLNAYITCRAAVLLNWIFIGT